MACGRAQIIKIALLAGFLLILLNLFGGSSRDSSHRFKSTQTNKNVLQWPRRTHSSYEKGVSSTLSAKQNTTSSNLFTIKQNTNSNSLSSNLPILVTNNTLTNVSSNFFSSTILPNVFIGNASSLLSSITTETNVSGGNIKIKHFSNISREAEIRITYSNTNENDSISKFERDNKINNRNNNNNDTDSNNSSNKNNKTDSLPKYMLTKNEEQKKVIHRQQLMPVKLPDTNRPRITKFDIEPRPGLFESLLNTFGINFCPQVPPDLDGPIEVDTLYEKIALIEARLGPKLQAGGLYKPSECKPRYHVAIVVPYRDREQHLPIFLKNIHVFLMKQQIEYGIFIVEQSSGSLFNRASLMNVGFVEALKLNNWDCFVFHDVDLLPMDDRNLYTCPEQPRHLSVAVDTFSFKLPYSSIFGGVSAMTVKQFKSVNGFSNQFWGWGGEDDDMSNRLKHVGFHIARYPINIARYTMLSHNKEKANPKRYEKLVTGAKRFESDGLNSLKYKVLSLEKKKLYTWICVELIQETSS